MWVDVTKKKVTDDPGAIPAAGATTPGLSISAVSVGSISGGSATVTWTTSVASSSKVSYGVAPNRSQVTAETDKYPSAQVTSHSVVLSGLTAGKVYLFRVHSRLLGGKDGMGNQVMDGYQFIADGSFVAA
jgi:hypothetical protein